MLDELAPDDEPIGVGLVVRLEGDLRDPLFGLELLFVSPCTGASSPLIAFPRAWLVSGLGSPRLPTTLGRA